MADCWQIHKYVILGSTNDEIARFCTQAARKIVVQTKTQTSGRGRRGRTWQSLDGNLFFSLALEFPLKDLGILVLISGLSVLQTVRFFAPNANIKLKWPNDVLLNDAKVCGILLEKGPLDYMIAGIGVNIAQSPHTPDMLYKTTSLSESGIIISTDDFLKQFLTVFDTYLNLYAQGHTRQICQNWLENAKGIGQKVTINQENQTLTGIFKGIDENGGLLLKNESGITRVLVGDVFYTENE